MLTKNLSSIIPRGSYFFASESEESDSYSDVDVTDASESDSEGREFQDDYPDSPPTTARGTLWLDKQMPNYAAKMQSIGISNVRLINPDDDLGIQVLASVPLDLIPKLKGGLIGGVRKFETAGLDSELRTFNLCSNTL